MPSRVIGISLGLAVILASVAPCVCPLPKGAGADPHDCCAATAGIRAAAPTSDCCSVMRQASSGVVVTDHPQAAPSALLQPHLDRCLAAAPTPLPRPASVASSPPSVLRI